jgi:ABC-type branched-subunit amino acid transport system substrate-binding protein
MRVRALGQWVLQGKEWKRWAIVQGDSRAEARLAESARQYLESNGGRAEGTVTLGEAEAHAPAPLLERLRGIPADFVYVALIGEKQELFLDAYQKAGFTTPAGGAEPELVRMNRDTRRFTGYWSTGWSHQHDIFGASELNNRFVDFAGIAMNERAWAAWAGVKILGEAILRAGSPAPERLVPYLERDLQFDGYMGAAMNFRPWNHQLRQSLFIARVNHDPEWNGWDALALESLVPLRRLKGWRGDPLDSIGLTEAESGCRY